MSRRNSLTVISTRRFLQLSEVEYVDGHGKPRRWELAQRTTRAANAEQVVPFHIDAVDIFVRIQHRLRPDNGAAGAASEGALAGEEEEEHIVVVSQYRPPVDAMCLEFPAGLVDVGEDPVTAALRELREETGYVAEPKDCHLSPVLAYEPGITDSCFHFVSVTVDARLPENQAPKQHLDEGEFVEVHLLERKDFLSGLIKLQGQLGPRCVIDSKLYTFAAALGLANQ